MKIMEAIKKGFNVTSKNKGLLTVLFIFNFIWNIATLPFMLKTQPANAVTLPLNAPLLVLSIIFIFLNIFMQGGVLGVLKDIIPSEGKVALKDLVGYGKKFYVRFLGMGLFILAILILAALVLGIIISIAAAVKNVILNIIVAVVGLALLAIALYYLFLIFFSPYALVVDDSGIFKAMGSSMRFIRGNMSRVIGISTLLLLVGLGIGVVAGVVIGIFSIVLKATAFDILTAIISSAVNSYVTVMISMALLVYYCALSGNLKKKDPAEVQA